ncbi:polysaccharide deacetylase family protein [Haliangium ochraceum]|uniref:Polysaccharide deacetylase n=1 Tax=Haliangium ochraceum (strain DSM 14365 / JCM 11303 / SMP-2) TaxID=502025 RepID=D0LQC5_HALO1|nr:polysaccharide deacetylase family protein [Haliangium ochraceum]ACY18934.1 polysaccharide deacetylase [Haliangium ochraceum DSM 14365]
MLGTGRNPLLKQLIKKPVIELFSRKPLRRIICWRFPRDQHRVALTFDDGPHPEYTPKTLDILAEHSIKATFFVLGSYIENHPDIFRRMVSEGHEIGIHGYVHTHDNLGEQTLRTLDIVSRFGVTSTLFRPPNGFLEARTGMWMVRHGFSMVFWSVDGRDSMRYEGKDSSHQPYEEIRGGDIVLLHDDNPVCVEDLSTIISVLKEKSLKPARVSEMLVDA